MPNLEEKLRYQTNRNHIMEQGLHTLNQNLEERRERLVKRQNALRKNMQQLGAKLDQAEQMSNQKSDAQGQQNVGYENFQKQEEKNAALDQVMEQIRGYASKLADNQLLEDFETRLQAELGAESGQKVYAYLKQSLGSTLTALVQEYDGLISSKNAFDQKTGEPLRQQDEQKHAAAQLFDEVEQWEHSNWNKCTKKIKIPALPTISVDPADGSEQYLERLMAAFEQMNASARDQQKTEQQLDEMEKQIAVLEGQLADYSKRVDAAIGAYENIATQENTAITDQMKNVSEHFEVYRAKVQSLLNRASLMQQAIEQAVKAQKEEDIQAKMIAYYLLAESVAIQEQENQIFIITDIGKIIDNLKPVALLKKERQSKSRQKMTQELKDKGWAVLEDQDISKMREEWAEEAKQERIEQVEKAVKYDLLKESKQQLERKEKNQYEAAYEAYLAAGYSESLAIMREISNHMKAIDTKLPDVKGVADLDRLNPFSALESGGIQPDGVEVLRSRVIQQQPVQTENAEEVEELLKNSEKEEVLSPEYEEAAKKIQGRFMQDVMDLHIDEVFAKPSKEKPAEDYPCMKASASLDEQICNLHFSKKRWEEDTVTYREFLEAADRYEMAEHNFREDDFSLCPRSEVAQYAVENAKQELLEKAAAYLAFKKKLTVDTVMKMDQQALLAMLSDNRGVGARRLNAAIHIIDTLHHQSETKMKFHPADALQIFSGNFRTCLIEGVRSFWENHRKMDVMYGEAYYQDNLQLLRRIQMRYGKTYSRMNDINAYMKDTYDTLNKLSKSREPLTSEDWKKAIFCAARIYVFHLMNQNPENNRNMGTAEMEKAAKSLVERSYDAKGRERNGFGVFVREYMKNKSDIAAVQKHVEECEALNAVAMKDGRIAAIDKENVAQRVK